ncbi:CDP-glycerol glycerophosphotransferase family protein [Aeromicrobium duanguangcaii]|uniref:CDP-glycerol glycerophosphotransferase family protein n=1 Tax=Aeromicrobium duanguangcaii TaxID=2968086 RepID=A0ABY5KI06_9ACTN|nr:CDP-glycerol glycerophosphotransferase family protein [Aeromicrobium duanguangcaii]MCD9153483.1 CDP-glycerol glycerophosphotransferase family protein [Aeromicrobium duanguangcaii]UUI69429.1 CDP-glycerol glycerophosphotransferase family protein [Aeromicrobium duanguangcaii]
MASPASFLRALVARLGRSSELPGLLLVNGTIILALLLVVLDQDLAAVITLLVSIVSEWWLERRSPTTSMLLRQASAGPPLRFALRALVAVAASSRFDDRAALYSFVAVALVIVTGLCARALHAEYRRIGPLKPMRTRHIPGATRIDEEPTSRPVLVATVELAAVMPAVFGAAWYDVLLVGAVAFGALMAGTVPEFRTSWQMRAAKRATGFTPQLSAVQEFIDEYQPEVIVHLSGPDTAAYQINTWIEALESLDQRVFVILRDHPLFEKMAPSSLPTLSLPAPSELLMLDFSSARVALYPSNTGNNIHLLRLPTMMSAFIGHGDSDKSASNNPFSRVYDELWVAGEAGADRYRRSGMHIPEDQFRFVGRPQVHAILPTPRVGDAEIPTVLYAPTWEGVNQLQEYSSLRAIGVQLIDALLADGSVRVVYKPHPFTGQRDAKYRTAHVAIVRRLNEAKLSTGIDHRVVSRGSLTDWMNQSTALISDISSVLSDWLAGEKPYAVFNHTGMSTKQFREQFPSSAAATLLDREAHGVDELIDVVTGRAPDQLAEYRSKLASYLLGPPEQRTLEAFREAVTAFVARSEAERAMYR